MKSLDNEVNKSGEIFKSSIDEQLNQFTLSFLQQEVLLWAFSIIMRNIREKVSLQHSQKLITWYLILSTSYADSRDTQTSSELT